MVSLAKLLAVAVCALPGRTYLASELAILRRDIADLVRRRYFTRLALFLAVYPAVLLLAAPAPFLQGNMLRAGLVSYLSISAIAVVVHRNTTGQYADQRAYFDEDFAEILLREIKMAPSAFIAYRQEILSAVIPGLLLMAILLLPPSTGLTASDDYGYALVSLTVFIAICYRNQWIFIPGKGWPITFPPIIMIPIKSILLVTRKEIVVPGRLSDVTLTPGDPLVNKVVFIMDESIRGDYTTLGNPHLDTTPYLSGFGNGLVDFGVATAGHNCSSYSRYMLRHGARPEALPLAVASGLNLPGPTIWQYAKAAGLRTVYIDGFSNDLRLHSGMSLRETALIDAYVKIPSAAPYDRDMRVADCLLAALADPAPAFTYVDKHGAHLPYDNRVPPGYAAIPVPPHATRTERLVASYKNAVRWNVDEFFRRVLTGRDLSDSAMIYTSDPGQSLMEGGYSASHCSMGPHIAIGEALVPLFAVIGGVPLCAELWGAVGWMRSRASHFDIFPTLLLLLGYDRQEVASCYGASLLGMPAEARRFLAGFKTSARWVAA